MSARRRHLLLAAASGLAGCAAEPSAPSAPEALATPLRAVGGGIVGQVVPGVGLPARPSGLAAKLVAPSAVALRDLELLVADPPTGRLWRVDTLAGGFVAIGDARVGPQVSLALGPDLSAWVLDPADRQVLRYGRDGRLLQTWPIGVAMASPVSLALADGGATLLVADGLGAQWSEQRSPGGLAQLWQPSAQGTRVQAVDALVPLRDGLFVLDRLAGLVHRLRRDGTGVETLGRGDLLQPQAIAADRFERVFVLDPPARQVVVLQSGRAARKLSWESLGVRQPVALACDGQLLALADPPAGQVQLVRLGRGDAP